MGKKAEKKKIRKKFIRWFVMVAVVLILILFSGQLFESTQIMNKLDYNIVLNEDGSATITETWDVYTRYTNTLFRNFKKSDKFGDITDVKVIDLQTGMNLLQINEEMYHVTKNCFYALDISPKVFEIAWGIGMDNRSGTKKYQICYTVTNVLTDYKDCQEFYWMLLNKDNGIPVKRVTGTIKFPEGVKNRDNLKAWGHGPLNGNIEIVSNDTIKFTVDDLPRGKMLEVRAVTTEKMFNIDTSKTNNYNYLNKIINEETKWSDESNSKAKVFYVVVIIIYILAIIRNIILAIKAYKISKKKDDGIIHRDLKYFRDIPREDRATPAEATYLYFFNKDTDTIVAHQADTVSAIILNLALKKYISLRTEEEKVYVDILKNSEGLNQDEEAIYKIIEGTKKQEAGEFEISKINGFAKKHYDKYSLLINRMVNESRESLYKEKLVDKANRKLYNKAKNAEAIYSFLKGTLEFLIIGFLIGLIPTFEKVYIDIFSIGFKAKFIVISLILLPLIVTSLIKLKMRAKTQSKIAILTQKGTEEQEEWKALAKYMTEFSLLKEREVPELALWEKYLVYATAFGIADKVIEQMKAKYPEVFVEEYWKDEEIEKYQVLNFATHNIVYHLDNYNPINSLSNSTKQAYKTSLAEIARHTSSSGSGGGGGFSGGGGGRWWRWPEWDGR